MEGTLAPPLNPRRRFPPGLAQGAQREPRGLVCTQVWDKKKDQEEVRRSKYSTALTAYIAGNKIVGREEPPALQVHARPRPSHEPRHDHGVTIRLPIRSPFRSASIEAWPRVVEHGAPRRERVLDTSAPAHCAALRALRHWRRHPPSPPLHGLHGRRLLLPRAPEDSLAVAQGDADAAVM